MGGTLVFRASRVPAQTLLDYLDDGYTLDEFLGCSPPSTAQTPWSFFVWREMKAMRIVLDENLPRPLMRIFGPGRQVVTVQELGLAGVANGALLAQLEGDHDVFVTADKNLRYQQNLAGRGMAIVELPTNRLPRPHDHDGRHRIGGDVSYRRFVHPGCFAQDVVS